MEVITQSIGQVSPLLIGRSKEDIIKFMYNNHNNNWRRRNGYPMKRKGLNKRKRKTSKCFYVDESYLFFDENNKLPSSTLKRIRKNYSKVN